MENNMDELQTDTRVKDTATSPIQETSSSNGNIQENILDILGIPTSSKSKQGIDESQAVPLNKGDVAMQNIPKDGNPQATTSAVGVQGRKPRVRSVPVLRQVLPRKSKEKAKQLLRMVAKGIIIPGGLILQERRRRRPVRRPIAQKIHLVKKRRVSKKSIQTVWKRQRKQNSYDSLYDRGCGVCGSCSCSELYY